MDQPERVRYFDQQFLRVEDFNGEQDYHRDMRRRHNRMLHTPGISDGLLLQPDGTGVKITPGAAVADGADGNGGGAEIVLADGRRQELSTFPANADVYVTIRFDQEKAREKSDAGVKDFTRWRENPVIEAFPSDPTATTPADPNEPLRVLLGKVTRGGSGGKDVVGIDIAGRRLAGAAESELSLTPRNPAIPPSDYVRLRWIGRGEAELSGSLRIAPGGPAPGDLAVAGGLTLGAGVRARSLRIDSTAADPRVTTFTPGALSFHFPGSPGGADVTVANDAPSRLSLTATTTYVSGRLGIGTSAPAHPLHVSGSALFGNTFVGEIPGYGSSWAGVGHRDAASIGSYALLHLFDGRGTYLNKRSGGGTIEFRVDNNTKLAMDDPGNLSITGVNFYMAGKNVLRADDGWLRLNQDEQFPNGVHSPGLISAASMNVGGVGSWSGPFPTGYHLVSGRIGIGTSTPVHSLHSTGNGLLNNVFVGDVGYGDGWAGISHRDAIGADSYGLLMLADGRCTLLNKRSGGGTIEFRVDNATRLSMDDPGNLSIAGVSFNMAGKNALRASDNWLRLNEDGQFPNGVHSPGLISSNSMNVGGVGSWSGPFPPGYHLVSGRIGIGTSTPAHSLHSTGNGLLGNVFVGDVGHGDGWAGISHRDAIGADRYGLLMLNDGRCTFLNKRSGGGTIEFRVDNIPKLAMDDAGTLFMNGKNAIQSADSWLRLNQGYQFTDGTYTPGKFRADGGIEVLGGGLHVDGDVRLGANDRVVYIGGNQNGLFMQFHDDLWFSDPQNGTIAMRNHNNTDWGTLVGYFGNKSSRDVKHDIETVAGEDLSRLYDDARATRVVRFRYNGADDTKRPHVGVIAEESPDYILGVDGASISLMEYSAMLHGAVQVLATKVEELQNR